VQTVVRHLMYQTYELRGKGGGLLSFRFMSIDLDYEYSIYANYILNQSNCKFGSLRDYSY
jgi:hypothetical protein